MKFGHDLAKVAAVSDPEWAPFFIQYKQLKKCLKVIDEPSCVAAQPSPHAAGVCESGAAGVSQQRSLAQSAPEVAFFRALREELRKSSHFFRASEQVLEIRRERVAVALRQLRQAAARGPGVKPGLLDHSDEKALSACVAFYRDLLLLENYAVINYCGFSKILKKHDKRTGFDTRARFMRVCVAPCPFTHYPRLLEMIKEAEQLYKDIAVAGREFAERATVAGEDEASSKRASDADCDDAAQSPAALVLAELAYSSHAHSAVHSSPASPLRSQPPPPSSDFAPPRSAMKLEESEFIDAILNLRSEARRLRQAEDDLDPPKRTDSLELRTARRDAAATGQPDKPDTAPDAAAAAAAPRNMPQSRHAQLDLPLGQDAKKARLV